MSNQQNLDRKGKRVQSGDESAVVVRRQEEQIRVDELRSKHVAEHGGQGRVRARGSSSFP